MMVKKILTVLSFVTILSGAIGCAGPKTCLFGRGARCGLCTRVGQAINPYSAPFSAPYAVAPYHAPCAGPAPVYSQGPMIGSAPYDDCQDMGGYAVGMAGDCNCENGGTVYSGESYGGQSYGSSDPYLNGTNGTVVPSVPGAMSGDNFQTRRYDTDGNVILREDPLPPGAVFAP